MTGFQAAKKGSRNKLIRLKALPDDVVMARMIYGDRPPRISSGDLADLRCAAVKILSQKKDNWSYEREWRIFSFPVGMRQIHSNERVIRAIYLGSRISRRHRSRILEKFNSTKIIIRSTVVRGYNHTWSSVSG